MLTSLLKNRVTDSGYFSVFYQELLKDLFLASVHPILSIHIQVTKHIQPVMHFIDIRPAVVSPKTWYRIRKYQVHLILTEDLSSVLLFVFLIAGRDALPPDFLMRGKKNATVLRGYISTLPRSVFLIHN